MALKVNKTETNALVTLEQALPMLGTTTGGMVQVSTPDSRLPSLKLVYPIEVDPSKGILPEHAYTFVVSSGDSIEVLPEGYTLTVLAARDAVRQLEVEINGTKVRADMNNPQHKALKAGYTRAFKALGKYNKTQAGFENGLKNGWDKGAVYLLAVLVGEKTLIAELSAFKTQALYWYRPLAQAILNPHKLGCTVLVKNHAANIKSAKSDPTKKYLDPAKFNQYQISELTPEQIERVVRAVENAKADVDAWFDR